MWGRKQRGSTYSVVGVVVDDGSTFVPAMTMTGDVRHLLADKVPIAGSVLYVVGGVKTSDEATEWALVDFERKATSEIWERGDVRCI